ncbi:hypothetical protein CEQ21_08545 [Niallia circulans]|uniref:Uncharacterized protein n=1 Tax=Niallia circulans TaxID=1397 RepID=A0A553SFA7_NIACI|nr:DUF6171 family protein [Niallia circulans]TRZ35675.1 hypothetical protein CEQ21_08545 [Niallia circulans]
MGKNICKGCVESVIVSEEVIEELLEEAAETPEKLVCDSIYQERLGICSSCDSLQYGTTCAYSGCIIRYRAKFKGKACPNIGNRKWNKVV